MGIPWSAAEDELLFQYVHEKGCYWRAIRKLMPRRSDDAIRNRFKRLCRDSCQARDHLCEGLSERNNVRVPSCARRYWKKEEDDIIRQHVECKETVSWIDLAEKLPGRTCHAIRNRYHRIESSYDGSIFDSVIATSELTQTCRSSHVDDAIGPNDIVRIFFEEFGS